jgi:E3 ubiquitin-protein ligase NEDD4
VKGYTPTAGSTERTKLLRLKVIAGHNLAKKDIFGASDPYTRIDLVTQVRAVEIFSLLSMSRPIFF